MWMIQPVKPSLINTDVFYNHIPSYTSILLKERFKDVKIFEEQGNHANFRVNVHKYFSCNVIY